MDRSINMDVTKRCRMIDVESSQRLKRGKRKQENSWPTPCPETKGGGTTLDHATDLLQCIIHAVHVMDNHIHINRVHAVHVMDTHIHINRATHVMYSHVQPFIRNDAYDILSVRCRKFIFKIIFNLKYNYAELQSCKWL